MISKKNLTYTKCSPNSERCPISNTHHRLKDVLQLWLQAAQTYHEPEKFKINVNAIIQTIRNVTFVLQNEKKNIPDFESWYNKWRERFREDDLMRWLHNARNRVVKQGDLSVASKAHVVIKNWLDCQITELDVPPHLSAKQIAVTVCKIIPKNSLKKFGDTVIFVERRWSVPDLPNKELLDVFFYAYQELFKLVNEAHNLCGYEIQKSESEVNSISDDDETQFFKDFLRIRSAYINPKNGELIDSRKIFFPSNENLKDKVKKRYKINNVSLPGKKEDDPFVRAEALLAIAKKILVKDRFHIPMVFFILPEGDLIQWGLSYENQEDKYVLYRDVAIEVEAKKARSVIFVGEVWYIMKEEHNRKRPSESSYRKEALNVLVACSDGRIRSYITFFERNILGRIQLEKTKISEGGNNFFLYPILEVWANWNNASTIEG